MRIRLLITASIILGALAWLSVAPSLRSAQGESGYTLLWSNVGLLQAILLVFAAGLPAIALGLINSAVGNPLSGFFVIGMSLLPLAWKGGPINGWMHAHELPASYHRLLAECLMWEIGLMIVVAALQSLRETLRVMLPVSIKAWVPDDEKNIPAHPFSRPTNASFAAGAVCCIVALIITHLLVQSSSNNQVLCSLVVAFSLGGLAGKMAFPKADSVIMLLTPGLVGAVAYSFVILTKTANTNMLAQWYSGQLSGLALVLPMHYFAGGLAGTALGIGWAQGLLTEETDLAAATTPPTPPTSKADNA